MYVCGQRPLDVDAALSAALLFESTHMSSGLKTLAPTSLDTSVNNIQATGKFLAEEIAYAAVSAMRSAFGGRPVNRRGQGYRHGFRALPSNSGRPAHTEEQRSAYMMRGLCFNRGDKGHMANECPKK